MAQGRNLRSRAEVRNEIPGPAWSNKDRKSRTPDRAGAEGFGKRRNSLQRRVGIEGVSGSHEHQEECWRGGSCQQQREPGPALSEVMWEES